MGAYLSEPVTDKISSGEAGERVVYGASSMQGWRVTQEDAHNSIVNFDENTSFFAVYDGHGGHEVARYTAQKFPDFLKDSAMYKEGKLQEALSNGFLDFDKHLVSPAVLRILDVMSREKSDQEGSNSPESETADNVRALCQEAQMPLEEVMAQYSMDPKQSSKYQLMAEGSKAPASPTPRAHRSKYSCLGWRGGIWNSNLLPSPLKYLSSKYSNSNEGTSSESQSGSSSSSSFEVTSSSNCHISEEITSNGESSATSGSQKRRITLQTVKREMVVPDSSDDVKKDENDGEVNGVLLKKTDGVKSNTCVTHSELSGDSETDVFECASKEDSSNDSIQGENSSADNTDGVDDDEKGDVTKEVVQKEVSTECDVTNTNVVKNEVSSVCNVTSPVKKQVDPECVKENTITSNGEDVTSSLMPHENGDTRLDDDDDDDDSSTVSDVIRQLLDQVNELEKKHISSIDMGLRVKSLSASKAYSGMLPDASDSDSDDEGDETFHAADDSSDDDVDDEEMDEEEGEEEEDCDEDEDSSVEAEEDLVSSNTEVPGMDSGCTAVVALLRGNELLVANAGDSRCVLSHDGIAVDMSIDHKPEDDEEHERIINAGGKVTSDGRVNGGLNLSRALGDHAYKQSEALAPEEQMITAFPGIQKFVIDPKKDEFMILACDGIWNYMTSQQVVDFVRERLYDTERISHICEELFDHCLAPNTLGDGTGCDNMTAVIVRFLPTIAGASSKAVKRGASRDSSPEERKRVKTDDDSSET